MANPITSSRPINPSIASQFFAVDKTWFFATDAKMAFTSVCHLEISACLFQIRGIAEVRINDLPRIGALCAASLAGLVAVFAVLQALSLTLASDQRIIENMAKSIDRGQITEADALMTPYGRLVEFWSDCNAISVNLGNITDSMEYRLWASPTIQRRREHISSPCRWLVSDIRSGKIVFQPYYRYWHGPQIYLRPLLSFTTISNVRVLNALLLIASATYLLIQLARQIGPWAIPATIIPLAVGTDILAIAASSSHSLVWGWALFSLAIIARLLQTKSPTESIVIVLVFSCGVIANFFDGLYSPAFVPAFVGFLVISNRPISGSTSAAICGAAILVTFWFAGYCASFASKWLLATAVLGWKYVIRDLTTGILQYSVVGDEKTAAGFLRATQMALHDLGPSLVTASWAIALLGLARALMSKIINWTAVRQFAVLQIPLLIPIIWIEALRDHSIVHPHYASRSLVLFAIVPLLAAICVTKSGNGQRSQPQAASPSQRSNAR
jgi:hypothetical protein